MDELASGFVSGGDRKQRVRILLALFDVGSAHPCLIGSEVSHCAEVRARAGKGQTVHHEEGFVRESAAALEALLADQAERCDAVVCFDGRTWSVVAYLETGEVEHVTVRVGGEVVSFERAVCEAVQGSSAPSLAELAAGRVTVDSDPVERAEDGYEGGAVRLQRGARLLDVAHLPPQERDVPVSVPLDGAGFHVVLRDTREVAGLVGRELCVDVGVLLEQYPELVVRSTVHHGIHYRTKRVWGESFVTVRAGLLLARALCVDEAEAEDMVLFLRDDGRARAWPFVAGDVVVEAVEHHGRDEQLSLAQVSSPLHEALSALMERWDGLTVIDAPALDTAAAELASRWANDGCCVGFHIVCVATGEYGPAVSVFDGHGLMLRRLGAGWTWGEALYGALQRTT